MKEIMGQAPPEMVTISRAEYESPKAERDELNQKLDWLLKRARLNRKKLYGVSSERLEEELMGQLRRGEPPIPGAPPGWRSVCRTMGLWR